MSESINELYLKYIDAVAGLEDDRYFRYLFEIIQAGENVLRQNRQVLHKVVDEAWLTMIEDTLEAINTIIEKPRRFVATAEEVVPVALARKITAQSVRHLSMNTQFIASTENGDIQPTRVLNITQEDSYDLYENRFIYHLIQKLVVFIDKRTDVIFWSTGDEIRNTMVLESRIDDAYEEIEYRLELKVKNHQSFAENDTDNMDVFMRIDRVRRMTMALRNSAFCELMAGCAKVRSPIQRTNLLMKDPNYRKCYQLWQFLENYEGVGYTIEEQNTALAFDEEYLIQMYINLIGNYAVFKSLTEELEDRNLEELEKVFHQVLTPKFVKEIHEEIVDDYNIPEVEVRQVIIEEVTQAQLDAEARLAEETALRQQAEARRDEAESEMQQAMMRSSQFFQQMQEAQQEAELARSLQEAAEAACDQAQTALEAAEQARDAAQTEQEAQRQAREAAEAALAESRRLQQESAQAREAAEQARETAEARAQQAEVLRLEAHDAMAQAQADAASAIAQARTDAATAQAARQEAEARAAAEAADAREARQAGMEAAEAKAQADAAAEEASRDAAEARVQSAAAEAALARLEERLREMEEAQKQAEARIQQAEQAREAAEAARDAHLAAREKAEAAQSQAEARASAAAAEAEQARQDARQADLDAARREKILRDSLAKCEKKLEKTKKKLENNGKPWLFGGRK